VKRAHFFKHLEKCFYSPVLQSIIAGLEGSSSNGILYSRNYRDSAETIWYDFKHQAMDLINNVNIWGNPENFKGTVDPNNPFLAGLPEQMVNLMKLLIEVGIKMYEECSRL